MRARLWFNLSDLNYWFWIIFYWKDEDLFDCRPKEQPLFAYNFMEEHLITEIRKHGRADLEEEAEFVKKTAILKKERKENGEPGVKVNERPLR